MNMILSLCFLVFPIAFAAVWNASGLRVDDPSFIRDDIIQLVPENGRERFIRNAPLNALELENEYDHMLQVLFRMPINYADSDDALKADTRKLWKYYKLQANFLDDTEIFTRETFFKIIDGSYCTEPFIKKIIEKDNIVEYTAAFGFPDLYYTSLNPKLYPFFSQISFVLLQTDLSHDELGCLVKNACYFPHIFDNFFKYLAHNVFNVSRDALVPKIRHEFPDNQNSDLLHQHQVVSMESAKGTADNIFLGTSIASLILCLSFSDNKNKLWAGVAAIIALRGFKRALRSYFLKKYSEFSDTTRESAKEHYSLNLCPLINFALIAALKNCNK